MLDVADLRVRYGKVEAVKGVSLHVADNEIVGIIGPNGAGKSSTLRAISGLIADAEGTIAFRGHELIGCKPHTIVRLGLIHAPEGRRLFPRLSVEENLRVGAYARHGRADASMREIVDLFPRLAERRRQLAGTLSGGEQQMLNIGRALMAAPRLLMLDEPSFGLAPMVVKEIGRAIVEINRRRRLTILLVEQNAKLALSVSQRAYVMENGRIALSGASAELMLSAAVTEAYVGGGSE
jgi:branched-chain amino acid transport system ATP-binding protein